MKTSVYETGHIKNVANFFKFNQFLATLGAAYNPSNTNIVLSALVASQSTAQAKQAAVDAAEALWKDAQNTRRTAFKGLSAFCTQLLGALKSSNAPQQTIDDFAFLVSKMRGDGNAKLTKADAGKSINPNPSTGPIVSPVPPPSPAPSTDTPTKSNSQQSFDQKIEHFSKMILILQGLPGYAPNETQFQLSSLNTKLANLTTANNAATNAWAVLKNLRIDRNLFFYEPATGFLTLIKQSKEYVKSIFGAGSQQYISATGYKFVRVVPKKKAK